MKLKHSIKFLVNEQMLKPLNLKIVSTAAFGRDSCSDIKKILSAPNIMFDVGANIGQTVELWAREFPNATIHSFEPVARLFNQLDANVGHLAQCNHLGVGDACKKLEIFYGKHDVSHSFVKDDVGKGGEISNVTTIDHYCSQHQIDRIDVLKIDVEGFEPQVIKGAHDMLMANSIDLIVVELGFDPSGYYVFYPEFAKLMRTYEYKTLGFYDQTTQWDGSAELLFCNVLFARNELRLHN